MSEEKQYAERDLMAMDVAGNYYCRHVSAMTREQLHSKSDVAAELGWRDMQIAELKAQRDALASENAALKSAIVIAKDGLQEHYDTDGVDSQDSEGNLMDACIRLCDAQSTIEKLQDILTPATAAYLNSVRAEGVASFAHHQRVIADSETDPTIQRGHRITACRAEDFAAQLRAGEPS